MLNGFFDFFKRAPRKMADTMRDPRGMAKGMRHMPGKMMDTGREMPGKMMDTGREMPGKMMDTGDEMIDMGKEMPGKMMDTGNKMMSKDERRKRRGRKRKRIQELEELLAQCQEEKGCPPCDRGGPDGEGFGKRRRRGEHPHGGPPGQADGEGFGKRRRREEGKQLGLYGYNPYFSGWA